MNKNLYYFIKLITYFIHKNNINYEKNDKYKNTKGPGERIKNNIKSNTFNIINNRKRTEYKILLNI